MEEFQSLLNGGESRLIKILFRQRRGGNPDFPLWIHLGQERLLLEEIFGHLLYHEGRISGRSSWISAQSPCIAQSVTRNTLFACLLISFLSSSLVFGKPDRRSPASLTVHTYTFTSAVFPTALLPLKEEYEKQKPMTSYQGWQGVGKKAEMINLLRQLSVLNGPQMTQQTSIYPVEGAAEAAAHWQKIQAELAALVSHPEIGKPYFGLVLSLGELPGTILHQLATGYPVWVAGQQSYLSLVYSATLRPGGFVCHIFQNNDDPRSPYRYYCVIVSCDLPSR